MHVIPPNGFPNVPSFADLDAIAKQIENMPTFTSDDRAFLSDLPSYPSEDGTKVLTATTTSGETSLSYEEVENVNINYSTEEQATGKKWIDGKDTYIKTISLVETDFTKTNNWFWQKDIEPSITGYDTIVKIYGAALIEFDGSKHFLPFGSDLYNNNNSDKCIKFANYYRNIIIKGAPYNDSDINFATKNLTILKCNITIEYTKTTT